MTITKHPHGSHTHIVQTPNRRELRKLVVSLKTEPAHFVTVTGTYLGTVYADGEYLTANPYIVDADRIIYYLNQASTMRILAKGLDKGSDDYRRAITDAFCHLSNARELRLHLAS